MKTNRLIIIASILLVMLACKVPHHKIPSEEQNNAIQKPEGSTSENALDWKGVYEGVFPCADCEGIKTKIELLDHMNCTLQSQYLGKDPKVYTQKGTFLWDNNGQVITIIWNDSFGTKEMYFVGENTLSKLDANGQKINGDLSHLYVLKKALLVEPIVEKYWKLIEFNSSPVHMSPNQNKEAYFILKSDKNAIIGFSGCNQFGGTYQILPMNRIVFTGVASTMMACPNVDETWVATVFHKSDSYQLNNDTLSLSKSKMGPMAKFVAVYF